MISKQLLLLALFFWSHAEFKTFLDAVKFVNGLPDDQRPTAYIVPLTDKDIAIRFVGDDYNNYSVLWQEEQK